MFKLKTEDDKRFMEAAIKAKKLLRKAKAFEFDMASWGGHSCDTKTCGTSHCIGGWMDVALDGMGYDAPFYHFSNLSADVRDAAHKLFNPSTPKGWLSKKKHGIQALKNFINLSSNPWRGVDFTS